MAAYRRRRQNPIPGWRVIVIGAALLGCVILLAVVIKRYLVNRYSIAGSDLVTVGYGKSKLKDPANPMSEANRRVQVVIMANKTTASK